MDPELQGLRRAAAAAGVASAQLLAQRIRLGELDPNMVKLAAWAGEAGALEVFPEWGPPHDVIRFSTWLELLVETAFAVKREIEVMHHAALAAARLALEAGDDRGEYPHECSLSSRVRTCACLKCFTKPLGALEHWLSCPCGAHQVSWLMAHPPTRIRKTQFLPRPGDTPEGLKDRIWQASGEAEGGGSSINRRRRPMTRRAVEVELRRWALEEK